MTSALDEFYKLLERQEQERKDVIARLRLNGATVETVEVGDILVSYDSVFEVHGFERGLQLWNMITGEEVFMWLGEVQDKAEWLKVVNRD